MRQSRTHTDGREPSRRRTPLQPPSCTGQDGAGRTWIFEAYSPSVADGKKPVRTAPSCPSPSPCSGQAAIEFAASLLLFLLILIGLVHVNRMARTSLFLHAVLRGDAGEKAMADTAPSAAPLYISDWQPGADDTRYTADDQPTRNGAILPAVLSSLTGHSVKNPEDWNLDFINDSRLPISMIQINSSPLMATTLGFVHAEETLHMSVDPFIRQLVYGKDEVAIKEEVWMPLMGGLY
ncbi:MAG: hypothetical protein WCK89_12990 [bacterium]